MIIGKVVGKLWATRKDESLNGQKFLLVRMLEDEEKESRRLFVAADAVGAGGGDLVLITQGGAARKAVKGNDIPIDATIVGIVDSLEVE